MTFVENHKYNGAFMKNVFFLILLLTPLSGFAQETDGFSADRPGATTGTDVMPKSRVQWETGFAWERSDLETQTSDTWTLNTTLLRWGFSGSAELRFQADYLYTSANGNHSNGWDNIAFGTKVRLFDGWKAIPTVSLLANVFVPGGSHADFLPEI